MRNLFKFHIKGTQNARNLICQKRFIKHISSLYIVGVTGLMSILLGLGKIFSGILAASVFTCMNGLYTIGMAVAKYMIIIGSLQRKDKKKSWFYYKSSGYIMVSASLLYIAYSLWTIWHPKRVYYDKIIAITIATITFTEVGFSLYGILKNRKATTPVMYSLKTINLATSLIAMVLTQSAILSFASDIQNPSVNGLLGCIMGIIATSLGVYLICKLNHFEVSHEYSTNFEE